MMNYSNQVLRSLKELGRATSADVAHHLGISDSTARRWLNQMADTGPVRKTVIETSHRGNGRLSIYSLIPE
jgi:DeoR/GlpR family transcriptional regulator of sugar metabolism